MRQPGVLHRVRNVIEDSLTDLHLGGGMALDESGPLSNYTLELLRHTRTESQALRAVVRWNTGV